MILGYYEHVLGLPMNFFGTRKVGEIVSRFTDASKIRDAISSATLTIMIDSLMAIVGGAVLYAQNSTLFIIAVIVVALYGVIVFAFKKPVKKINEKQMEDNAQVTSYLVETLTNVVYGIAEEYANTGFEIIKQMIPNFDKYDEEEFEFALIEMMDELIS